MGESHKNRAICLIDGFNVYHSLKDSEAQRGFPYRKYKWLNLTKLINNFVQPLDEMQEIYYFSSMCTWDNQKYRRHHRYIYALKNEGIKVRFGKFKEVTESCRAECKQEYKHHVEKRTDVEIAVTLIDLAYKNAYDNAYILTADTDQIPAIAKVRSEFKDKNVYLILPINSKADELSEVCNLSMKITEEHLKTSQFDLELISKATGKSISCPPEWRIPELIQK